MVKSLNIVYFLVTSFIKIDLQVGRLFFLFIGHADPMDFWDHSDWREIPQNDPTADVPTFITPHLVKHVQPNVKLILMLRQPAERYIL